MFKNFNYDLFAIESSDDSKGLKYEDIGDFEFEQSDSDSSSSSTSIETVYLDSNNYYDDTISTETPISYLDNTNSSLKTFTSSATTIVYLNNDLMSKQSDQSFTSYDTMRTNSNVSIGETIYDDSISISNCSAITIQNCASQNELK